MVVSEAVLETVFPPTFLAVHARHERGVDQGLAGWVGALLLVRKDAGFWSKWEFGEWALVGLISSARPLAGFGT